MLLIQDIKNGGIIMLHLDWIALSIGIYIGMMVATVFYIVNGLKWYKIQNFDYNGLYVIDLSGLADYKAKFEEWTDDPGIAVFKCSDGNHRLIPTCQIVPNRLQSFINPKRRFPKQDHKNRNVISGMPGKS